VENNNKNFYLIFSEQLRTLKSQLVLLRLKEVLSNSYVIKIKSNNYLEYKNIWGPFLLK
jgi:hypothetical protein